MDRPTPAFPIAGFVRLKQILAPDGPIPVSKSTWWAGIRDGRFPRPLKLGPGVTVWRAEDITRLLVEGAANVPAAR
jgi:prophage regulatory protein